MLQSQQGRLRLLSFYLSVVDKMSTSESNNSTTSYLQWFKSATRYYQTHFKKYIVKPISVPYRRLPPSASGAVPQDTAESLMTPSP